MRIRLFRKFLFSWIKIRICKNMRIHGSGSKGANKIKNSEKSNCFQNPNLKEIIKKKILIFVWFIKFQHKIMDPDPIFSGRVRIRIKIKWIGF